MDWAAGDLNRAWSYAFMALVRRDPSYVVESEVVRSAAAWNRLMGILDTHLGKAGPYAGGADFTLADIAVGLAAHRWRATPLDRPGLKHVAAYLDLLNRKPFFAALTTEELL